MADEVQRSEQKVRAIRSAEFRLKQRLEAIDWRHDVLTPELEELKANANLGELIEATLVADDEA